MIFNAWDTEHIVRWKAQIAATTATLEGLRAEIFHYFARCGAHDPDLVLGRWAEITAVWCEGQPWGAFAVGAEEALRRRAAAQGLRLEHAVAGEAVGRDAGWRVVA